MTSVRRKNRALLPSAGVVAAVATAVSGWAPIAQSAPEGAGTREAPQRAQAPEAEDGTYESCGAYFGFGKDEFGVLDVVDFDVSDQNGADGTDHAVPADTGVVLVLTNEDGDVLECTPEEVTEEQWDDAMDGIDIDLGPDASFPAWPGPGHYGYPTIAFRPFIDGFGEVADVAFRVTTVPAGHTLVSPTEVRPLVQHFLNGRYDDYSLEPDPRVLAFIEADAGAAALAAFEDALVACDGADDVEVSDDLADALNALIALQGYEPVGVDDLGCGDVGYLNADAAFLLGLDETVDYTEPIVLALPEETTTTSTTVPTTTPVVTRPVAATPIAGSPSYTG